VTPNPAATQPLPSFITAPGQTDVLFNIIIGFVVILIFAVMVLYFKLHAVPEHIAHKTDKIQYEIVAVLALISLFTHNHIYWILALLLALIRLPDFTTPLVAMAESLATMASAKKPLAKVEPIPPPRRTPSQPQQPDGELKDVNHA
jgi:hypothetical protein